MWGAWSAAGGTVIISLMIAEARGGVRRTEAQPAFGAVLASGVCVGAGHGGPVTHTKAQGASHRTAFACKDYWYVCEPMEGGFIASLMAPLQSVNLKFYHVMLLWRTGFLAHGLKI